MTHVVETSTSFEPTRVPASDVPALLADVQRVFAEVTRYPAEILEVDANIEEDLGIDSVKLGEILAALRERYDLPTTNDLRARLEPERMRTIAGIAGIVAQYAPTAPNGPRPAPTAPTTLPSAPASAEQLLDQVRSAFADITRYPLEILEANADLEEDLGIDSVKLGEIFTSLRGRFGLPALAELRERIAPGRMRTIDGITGVIAELVANRRSATESTAPPASLPSGNGTPVADLRQSDALPTSWSEPVRRRFEAKIVLVTGSGHGLGRDIARYLADQGATVVVNSFHSRARGEETAEAINAAGGSAVHIWASVANDTQRDTLFQQIESRFGGLDFLVHCASNGKLAPVDQITTDDWEKAFRTNVVGLHQSALRATRLMQRRGGGRIVALSITPSDRVFPYAACQGTVKAAIESLTRYLAVELAPLNIRVNCIKAGAIYGDLMNTWPDSATIIPAFEQRTPLGRMCRPSDVCALLGALLSDELEFVNASTIVLDGGHSARL